MPYVFLKVRRHRASPSRLFKLYSTMSKEQRDMIDGVNFGGLLKISCPTVPADLASWLMEDCFDPESSELVLPGRGRISVTTESVADIFDLPNWGGEVKYELDVEAINFIYIASRILIVQHPKSKKL